MMFVRLAHGLGLAEAAFVFAGFVTEQMTLSGAVTHHLAGGGDFEPFLCGLLRFR
jgi:hypothetical protein